MNISSPPFTLAPKEEPRAGFVRILGEISTLARRKAKALRDRVENVHDVRLLIKRLRALLWFARPVLAIGAEEAARKNLRKAARLLGGQRDLTMVHKTLDALGAETAKPKKRHAVASVSRHLKQAAGESPEGELQAQLKKSADLVCRAIEKIIPDLSPDAKWPRPSSRLEEAIEITRKAGKKARRQGKDKSFHSWRKKAKQLTFIAEFTSNQNNQELLPHDDLEQLQKHLGDDHDCVMALEHVRSLPASRSNRRKVTGLLHQREARLRKKARRIARRLDL